jgi:flagellar operon protein
MDRISQIQNINIEEVLQKDLKPAGTLEDPRKSNVSFKEILSSKISAGDVKFSKHAIQRINDRNINITGDQLKNINHAVEKADKKGSRESLILLNDVALVVSIRNKTVITAMNSTNLKENVVTNIDSAIII